MHNRCYSLSVALAPGSGLLARRDQSILFVPEPDERAELLLDAFDNGPIDELWDRLADSVVDNDFDVCAFACVTAAENIEIRVFGAVELKTDLRSVPMLSGAASKTWVEHRVHGHPHAAAITTGAEAVDERTALVDGVVHAGGFTAALIEHHARAAETIDIPSSGPSLSEPIQVDGPDEAEVGPDARATAEVVEGQTEDSRATDEESDLLAYVRDLAEEDGSAAPITPSVAQSDVPKLDEQSPEPTLPPGQAAQVLADSTPRDPSPAPIAETVPVSARVCKSGHANAPTRTTCQICDIFLPAGPDGVQQIARPSLGTLLLDDGRTVNVNGELAFGRNPSRSSDGWAAVVVEGDRVSRTHLVVRCEDWDVSVEDCGSHNGTVIVPADGEQPVALTAGTPHTIEPGATIYFGSSSFRFEGRKP